MPYDSAGNFSLVPSYKAEPGKTIRTEQHNPPLEDIGNALSNVLVRDGRNGMVGPLTMGGKKISGLADGSDAADAVTIGQVQSIVSDAISGTLGDAAYLDIGTAAGTVAAGDDSRLTGALQPTSTITDALVGGIRSPANQTYTLALKVPFGFTVSETTTICESGSCTAQFKINNTAMGGAAHSVSTTKQSIARASANVGVAGDDIKVTISANSSCTGLSFSVKFTRGLA